MYVLVALASAICFAIAVVIQQRAASAHGAHLSLIWTPLWLLGGAVDVCGFLLQVVALHLGGVVATQVLLVSMLPFGLLFGRVRLGRLGWAAVGCIGVGLAGILLAADPRPGSGEGRSLIAAVVVIAVIVGVLVVVTAHDPVRAAVGQAVAAGLLFALTATVAHAVGDELTADGVTATLSRPEVYLLAAVASSGLALEQRAFASGPLAMNLVVLTLLDPLASLGLGVVVAGDRLRAGPYTAAAVVAAGIGAAGVVVLSREEARARRAALAAGDAPAATVRLSHNPA